MSSKGLLAALAEIVRVSSQCSDFWKGGASFSRNWAGIVAEISNPETSEIGISRSTLIGNIELLESHCEMSFRHSRMALESAERSIEACPWTVCSFSSASDSQLHMGSQISPQCSHGCCALFQESPMQAGTLGH